MAYLNEEIAQMAADWWTEKISKFHHHDNGAYDKTNMVANALADILYKRPYEEQVEMFREKLKERILKFKDDDKVWLGVDYNPCTILFNIANECGIDEMCFPFKTDMVVTSSYIRVSDGYGKPWEYIFPTSSRSEQPAT